MEIYRTFEIINLYDMEYVETLQEYYRRACRKMPKDFDFLIFILLKVH